MTHQSTLVTVATILITVFNFCKSSEYWSDFQDRRASYIADHSNYIVEAKEGVVPFTTPTEWTDKVLQRLNDGDNNAERFLTIATRVLYLNNANDLTTYDTAIYDAAIQYSNGVYGTKFWVSNITVQNYWVEHKMIGWMSSAYLLNQKWDDLEVDDNLLTRLKAFLRLKEEKGFFQVNHPVSTAATMGALLNLADFARGSDGDDDDDSEGSDGVKQLAQLALYRLLTELSDNINSRGLFFPAQASFGNFDRWTNMVSEEWQPYIHDLIKTGYLLTGKGRIGGSILSSFLATSKTQSVKDAIDDGFADQIIGEITEHGISAPEFDFYCKFNGLDYFERTAFQLSAGYYFDTALQPEDIANDTANFTQKYGLCDLRNLALPCMHPEFAALKFFGPGGQANVLKVAYPYGFGLTDELLVPILASSHLSPITTYLYKDGPSMLSSMVNFNVGYLRSIISQQMAFGATTGQRSIFVPSLKGWAMPQLQQKNNVLLYKYDNSLLSDDAQLQLFQLFPNADGYDNHTFRFDRWLVADLETIGDWVFGEEADFEPSTVFDQSEVSDDGIRGYFAFYQGQPGEHCTVVEDGLESYNKGTEYNCDPEGVYAIVVGNSRTSNYGDFATFKNKVTAASWNAGMDTLTIEGIDDNGGLSGAFDVAFPAVV